MKMIVKVMLIVIASILVIMGILVSPYFISPQDHLEKADAIVAISGGDTTARTEEAVNLYKDKWSDKLILSGAALDPTSKSNAKAMKEIAVSMGVKPQDVYLDEFSRNTRDNAKNVGGIIAEKGIKTIILVTSPYHQRRAYLEFNRVLPDDVKIINHSAPDESWNRRDWWKTPKNFFLTLSESVKTLYIEISTKL